MPMHTSDKIVTLDQPVVEVKEWKKQIKIVFTQWLLFIFHVVCGLFRKS